MHPHHLYYLSKNLRKTIHKGFHLAEIQIGLVINSTKALNQTMIINHIMEVINHIKEVNLTTIKIQNFQINLTINLEILEILVPLIIQTLQILGFAQIVVNLVIILEIVKSKFLMKMLKILIKIKGKIKNFYI